MSSHSGYSGIRFNDCFFTEPVDLCSWTPPKCGGLFAVLVADPNWAPKSFQPLYFGEFGNNAPASTLLQECGHVNAPAGGKQIFISVLLMPFSTTQYRCALRNELVWAYNPLWQQKTASDRAPELAYKLAELEKKHHEQSAQVMHLIAGINQNQLQDPPPARRRRIGFLPFAEPAVD